MYPAWERSTWKNTGLLSLRKVILEEQTYTVLEKAHTARTRAPCSWERSTWRKTFKMLFRKVKLKEYVYPAIDKFQTARKYVPFIIQRSLTLGGNLYLVLDIHRYHKPHILRIVEIPDSKTIWNHNALWNVLFFFCLPKTHCSCTCISQCFSYYRWFVKLLLTAGHKITDNHITWITYTLSIMTYTLYTKMNRREIKFA